MLILYSILVLSVLCLIGVAFAVYCRVRKHMRIAHDAQSPLRIPPEAAPIPPVPVRVQAPKMRPESARLVTERKRPASL
jgi:hypothetical protein